jgi:hypothetical protein
VPELLFLAEVADDLSEASAWYEERQDGLGDAFLSCVEACLEVLRKTPELNEIVYNAVLW